MAANGPEVAKGYVSIIPSMHGAQQTITSELTGAMGEASAAAGNSFITGFSGKLGALRGVMAKLLPVAAVAAVGKALFDIGEEFDEMTDTIITGTGASGEALKELEDSAKSIATTVPVSFGDAGDIVQDLNTRLGLTGDTLTDVGTQIARIGDLTGESFDVEAFSGAMSAWGVSAEDMSGELDKLFAISQSTGIGINDLTRITESAAPQMMALGYSYEDTAAMAGLLDKSGLDASSTLTKMSKALTTMAKDGEDPAEALERTTTEIADLIEQGDEAAAIDLAASLFGTRGAPQFVQAVKNGSLSVDEFLESMGDTTGILADTEGRTMSFSEHVEVLKNQFKALLEPLGSAVFQGLSVAMGYVTDAFRAFVEGPGPKIGEVLQRVFDWGKQVAELFTNAFSKATGLESFADGADKARKAAQTLFNAVKPLISAFTSILKTILPPLAKILGTTLGTAFKVLGGIIKTAAGILRSFGERARSMRDTAVAAFSAIKGGAESFRTKLVGVFDTIRQKFTAFKDTITAPFRFLSGLKIPKIEVSGGKAPWGIGGKGRLPSFNVTWAAKGMILDNATLIGAGEAGREGLIPLEGGAMRPFAQAIADEMDSNRSGSIVINLNYDAGADAQEMVADIARGLKRYRMAGAF